MDVPHPSISWIYASIGCQHTLQPTTDCFTPPSIPALTAKGFVRWQSIEILLGPEEHVPFIQYAVANFGIKHPDTGESFPKELPKEAFPLKPDAEIEKWHTMCAEKLRQQATPPEEDEGPHPQPHPPPRPQVQTGYAHVRPSAYTTRERPDTRDFFEPKSRAGSRPIPYQHVSSTGIPVHPGMSSRPPSHRARHFFSPEAPESSRMSRSRRRSYPDTTSPITPAGDATSPHLEPPINHDHLRRHSHPRHARRGSYSSDASSEGDDPPSPPSPRNVNYVAGTARPRRSHPSREEPPPVRFAYPKPSFSPSVPASPESRSRTREERGRDEEVKRTSFPIPIDLSGKLSAPFLLGKRDQERGLPRNSSRGGKVSWKDLSDLPEMLRKGSKSSEEDRERERGRASRDEWEKDHGLGNGRSDYIRRERDRDRDRGQVRTSAYARPSSLEDIPRRDRDRGRERDPIGRDIDGRPFRDRDRDRRAMSPVRGVDGRYYSSGR